MAQPEAGVYTIRLYYFTSWQHCLLHYMDGSGVWKDYVMQSCQKQGRPEWAFAEISVSKFLEFVLCDKEKRHWDNPPFGSLSRNYLIELNGTTENSSSNPPSSTDTRFYIQQADSKRVPNDEDSMGVVCEQADEDEEASAGYTSFECLGTFTLVNGVLTRLSAGAMLLVCDLDGTLIGDESAVEKFNIFWLREHVWNDSKLVYNTGRNLKDSLNAICSYNLLKPDYLICGVGTEIYSFPGYEKPQQREENEFEVAEICLNEVWMYPSWCKSRLHAHEDEDWLRRMRAEFRRPMVLQQLSKDFHFVHINGNAFHDPWRVSLSVNMEEVALEPKLKEFANKLMLRLIISGSGNWRFVDLLPHSGGKLNPVLFLMGRLGFEEQSVIVCGDSGNDADMFCIPGVRGVCVANAHHDLLNFLHNDELRSVRAREYFTTLEDNKLLHAEVFFANKKYAEGILEGLVHFGFIAKA